MKKQLTTKSRDNKSDFTSGHASKPYISEGKHLLDCNTTSSFANKGRLYYAVLLPASILLSQLRLHMNGG